MNRAEAVAQVITWAGLVRLGAGIPEFGDAPGSGSSVLAVVTGLDPTAPVFLEVLRWSALAVVLAWGTLLLLVWTPHLVVPQQEQR